jgi:hypothetical protein
VKFVALVKQHVKLQRALTGSELYAKNAGGKMKSELKVKTKVLKELNKLEYLYTCHRCYGEGMVLNTRKGYWDYCRVCHGTGTVDWIEHVTRR